jgi:1,4-dihydroxy-2-naphthoate octaprenyltransferase
MGENEQQFVISKSFVQNIRSWVALSRPPFHTVGILPFILGTILAWRLEARFNALIFSLGVSAVVLIMLSTYHAGEHFDEREDRLSKSRYHSRFSGGSGIIPAGLSSAAVPLWTSIVCLLLAGIIGVILQFALNTGPYTLLLGSIGGLSGFFYSSKPFRFVERGVGELLIGFCYGWLPVASAYYIQTETVASVIHWISVPIALTIFNVIFLNEFPDYPSDLETGKRNTLIRIGINKGVKVFILVSCLAWLFFFLAIQAGVPSRGVYVYCPILILSVTLVIMALMRKHEKFKTLEIMCGANILVNLGTTAAFIFAYL